MKHLIEHGAGDDLTLHRIEQGNVGDVFTIQSVLGEDVHKVWISYIVRKAKERGIFLKRVASYAHTHRTTVPGKVGEWTTGSDFFTELLKYAAVVK